MTVHPIGGNDACQSDLAVEVHENWLEVTLYLNMDQSARAQEGESEGVGRL